jgi:hypothetical protein
LRMAFPYANQALEAKLYANHHALPNESY